MARCNSLFHRHLLLVSAPFLLMAAGQMPLMGQVPQAQPYVGEAPERYAQVKNLEGNVTVRKGDGIEEPLERGTPVGEGDVVESNGRGFLQLADGTRLFFGEQTRLHIAGLFIGKDASREVLVRLDYGRLYIAMGGESQAVVRVDMPVGTATLQSRDVASVELDKSQMGTVKVFKGRVTVTKGQDPLPLNAGERLSVFGSQERLERVRRFNTYEGDAFDRWCDEGSQFAKGPSWERVPREIRYYADGLDANGEWVYVTDCSTWCWRPRRIAAEWRPYWQGRWAAYPGGMTWISDEPWGYVTYHYGRWGWHSHYGWYWMPGACYSPAWVAWHTSGDYFGWAPLSHNNAPCHWHMGAWSGGCWNVVQMGHVHTHHVHHHVHACPTVVPHFQSSAREVPWRGHPMIVTPHEFKSPRALQQVVRERPVLQDRLYQYEQRSRRMERISSPPFVAPVVERPVRPGVEAMPRPMERPIPTPHAREYHPPHAVGEFSVRERPMARPQEAPSPQCTPQPQHHHHPSSSGRERPWRR